ncbi:MAG TPA: hypothetical protein VG345_15430, partial [Bryobacteraceae bacterium]|nr:hypothetical protein [Bryobacteraceae bacterium]
MDFFAHPPRRERIIIGDVLPDLKNVLRRQREGRTLPLHSSPRMLLQQLFLTLAEIFKKSLAVDGLHAARFSNHHS